MNLIKEYRIKKNWTQKKLAEELKVSVKTIQAIEQNVRRPGKNLTIKLFSILKIPISKLKNFLESQTTYCSKKEGI